jgi:GNAT superfamily N-acetyltransferase
MDIWRIEPLGEGHDRSSFDCGEESLNVFLRQHAGQNARKDISRTYVALPEGSNAVAGYYTLATGSLAHGDLPAHAGRQLPRYPVPIVHLGRLGVDRRMQSRGLGGMLLAHAIRRVAILADEIGIHAVTVQALNDRARTFYQAHGFLPLQDDPSHLYLPMTMIRRMQRSPLPPEH